jgi:putative phosphoesterase
MKILVLSDTHYAIDNPMHVIGLVRPSYIFHLGDMVSDANDIKKAYPNIQMHIVKGNNDFSFTCPYEKIVELFGNKFFLTHGHKYNVKAGLEHLARRAKALGASYALFGHTHLPFNGIIGGVRLLNPSSGGYILIENENCEVYKY